MGVQFPTGIAQVFRTVRTPEPLPLNACHTSVADSRRVQQRLEILYVRVIVSGNHRL